MISLLLIVHGMTLAACSNDTQGKGKPLQPNQVPTANAGADRAVANGAMVQLDGSASSDADGDWLWYQWEQTGGVAVTLSDATAEKPQFEAPAGLIGDEELLFSLVVRDSSSTSAPDTVSIRVTGTGPLAQDGFTTTLAAATSKGRFTFNNPWTAQDLADENMSPDLNYQSIVNIHPPGLYRAYTTLMETYLARRRQCEQDYNTFYAPVTWTPPLGDRTYTFRDRKCYPKLELANELDKSPALFPTDNQTLQRYGYYCGGGYPELPPLSADAPEPIDGVDYCCRLHDANAWSRYGDSGNECGIAMCLRQGSMYPAGLDSQLADVLESRSHWYGDGALAGAAIACPGVQSNNAPPLVVVP